MNEDDTSSKKEWGW